MWGMLEVAPGRIRCGECWKWHLAGSDVGNVGSGTWQDQMWGMLEVAPGRIRCGECWKWHLTGWGVGNVGSGT